MNRRYLFDSLIGVIGAWLLLILTLGLFYIIFCICEYKYMKKHSFDKPPFKDILKECKHELMFKYWYN